MIQRSDERKWDPNERTGSFLELLKDINLLQENEVIRSFVAKLRAATGAKIDTVAKLLSFYYADIRVLSMPDGARPALFSTQLERLYQEIEKLSANAATRKRASRMNLSFNQLVPCLNYAFDHLAKFPDKPELAFNFIDYGFQRNPIPEAFAT